METIPIREKDLIMMSHLAECTICGEYRRGTLRQLGSKIICFNCSNYAENKVLDRCTLCDKDLPCEQHHVYGRRVNPLTVPLCCNCHRWNKGPETILFVNNLFSGYTANQLL